MADSITRLGIKHTELSDFKFTQRETGKVNVRVSSFLIDLSVSGYYVDM
jgi:hypothetical protein